MFTCSKCQRIKETRTRRNKRRNKTLKRKVKGG